MVQASIFWLPFCIFTIQNPDIKNFRISNVCLDPYCTFKIQMFCKSGFKWSDYNHKILLG